MLKHGAMKEADGVPEAALASGSNIAAMKSLVFLSPFSGKATAGGPPGKWSIVVCVFFSKPSLAWGWVLLWISQRAGSDTEGPRGVVRRVKASESSASGEVGRGGWGGCGQWLLAAADGGRVRHMMRCGHAERCGG